MMVMVMMMMMVVVMMEVVMIVMPVMMSQGAIIRVLTYGGTPILLSGTSLFSATYHVGTRNSCYLRTYFLLVSHDLSKSKVFNTVI